MKKVLLIDSGAGGVNILKECLKVCERGDFLLFCDNKNLPYGNKSKNELLELTIKNLNNVRRYFDFDIVVFACNTLTSTCIEECRQKFEGVDFVGTVPAIKPALEEFEEKDVFVLATTATITHNKSIQKHPNLNCCAMEDLASLIDKNLDDIDLLLSYLKEKLPNESPKAVVLGCTHYTLLKKLLAKIYPNAKVFDSENGVARRLKTLMCDEEEGLEVKIITSKREDDMWAKLWHLLNK